jgi:hypothetical protein
VLSSRAFNLHASLARFSLTSDSNRVLIRVQVEFHPLRVLALVDTGSTYNLIDEEFAKNVVVKYHECFEALLIPALILGDGVTTMQPLGVLRRISFAFVDDKHQLLYKTSDFVVIQALNEKAVIGHHFFMDAHESVQHQAKGEISYALQALKFGRTIVPWCYETTQPRAQFLVCSLDTVIPPSSMACVPAELPGVPNLQTPWGFFSNVCPPGSHINFIESFGNLNISGTTPVWFSNSSLDPITLPKGHKLCLFEELDPLDHGVYQSGKVKPQTIPEPLARHSSTHPNINDRLPTTNMSTGLERRIYLLDLK